MTSIVPELVINNKNINNIYLYNTSITDGGLEVLAINIPILMRNKVFFCYLLKTNK